MPPSSRRRLLAAVAGGAVASLSGCVGPNACVSWSELAVRDEQGLALRRASDADVVEATDRTPADLHPLPRDIVRGAAEPGTETYHGARRMPPFSREAIRLRYAPRNSFVRLGETYYRIHGEQVAEAATTGYVLRATTDATVNAEAQSADPIRFADLPTHDRRTVLATLGDDAGRSQSEAGAFRALWTVGYLEDDLVESSALAPTPGSGYLRYRDYYVHLERFDAEEVELRNYEFRLEDVGRGAGAVAAAVRRTDGTTLEADDLPADQRAIVEVAAGGTYTECGDYSEALAGLRSRVGASRFARYDGTWYAVEWLP